jgi:hypothetical protein
MILFVAQDYAGNVHITDDVDSLPPDVIAFHKCDLPNKPRFMDTPDPTLSIDVQDYSEIVSIRR